jgi:hypothetical protein
MRIHNTGKSLDFRGQNTLLVCDYWSFVPLSDDVLQLAGLPGRLGEEQDPRGEAVQAVHRVQRLQPVLLNNIRVGDLRIRIQLFTSMRIRVQPFTLM